MILLPTDRSLHSFDLPADVFQAGEVKPVRQKKKPMVKKDESIKKNDSASKKRKHEADETEVCRPSKFTDKQPSTSNFFQMHCLR